MRKCPTPGCKLFTQHVSGLCWACRERREAQFAAEDALGDAMASRSCTGLTRDHLRDATKMAPAFDDPDSPESGNLTTEQALEQARQAVADGEAMLADLERNDRARQAEERDEAFSFDVALTREVMETMCQELTAARREATDSEGRKFDQLKPRLDLLVEGMPRALEEVARVLTFGSLKYADHNWQHVERAQQRYLAAGMRHELALATGETHDPETGAHHLAHKLCCDLFRLELALRGEEGEA